MRALVPMTMEIEWTRSDQARHAHFSDIMNSHKAR